MNLRSLLPCVAAIAVLMPARSHAAFGYTASNGGYIVNNGANLVVTINSGGDMSSCTYKGIEINSSAASGIASGLGASSVTAATVDGCIVIKCVSTSVAPSAFTHYYIVQNGVDNLYMADYATAEPNIGEQRFIGRFLFNVIPNGPPDSDNNGENAWPENAIASHPNGQTTSKYYGNQMDKDLTVCGATGSGVGVFMAFGNRESSSGGPFYRDIENQGDGTDSNQEMYNYMNSGHNQTEATRENVLYGPYAYVFTTGATPAVPDMSFVANLGLTGYVNAAGRGQVVLNGLSGMSPAYTYYMGFANSTAQYWATLGSDGSGECLGMKPGTYTMTIYKNQLAVYTTTATVSAGHSTTFNSIAITGDPSATSTIWRIGDWDGTPLEFLNGGNINIMHPSDVRNASWGPVTFKVGSPNNTFPAIQFRADNSPTTITFNLSAAQAAVDHTLQIGITDAYESGRPDPTINGVTLPGPGASSQPDSRSFTTGTYRGNNTTFTWSIPAADFKTGANTLTITPISGSSDLGGFLSAAFSYDCVELDGIPDNSFAGTYEIQNVASGLALNVTSAATTNNAPIIQFPFFAGQKNSLWTFVPTSGGYYQIVNANSGLDVVVSEASKTEAADIVQWSFGSSGDDQWEPVLNSDGSYTFYNLRSGQVLDDPGSSTTQGTQMDQWDANGGANQHWNLIAQ